MKNKKLRDKPRFLLKSTGKIHIDYAEDTIDPNFKINKDQIEVLSACGICVEGKDIEKSRKEITCDVCNYMLFKEQIIDTVKKSGKIMKPNLSLYLSKKAQKAVFHYATNQSFNANSINELIIEMLEKYENKLFRIPVISIQNTLIGLEMDERLRKLNIWLKEKVEEKRHDWGIEDIGFKIEVDLERQWYPIFVIKNRWLANAFVQHLTKYQPQKN